MPEPAQTTTTAAPSPAAPVKLSDEAYNKLTTGERAAYAAQFDQTPFQPGGSQAAGRTADTPPPAQTDGAAAPAGTVQSLAGDRFKIGEAEFSAQDLLDLAAHKGAEDVRLGSLPPDAGSYKHELPKDLKLPGGVDFTFNAEDPALAAAADWAHRNKLSQSQYSDLLGLYAVTQAEGQHQLKTAMADQISKLGVAGSARIDAIGMYVKGAFPDHYETVMGKATQKGAGFGGMLWTAAQVNFLEDVIAKLTGQRAGGGFSQQHREPPSDPRRVDNATYEAMSTSQQRAYAAQFDQSQFGGR